MRTPVTHLIVRLVEQQPTVAAIRLFRPMPSPPIQQLPDLSSSESRLIHEALALRSATAFPFWDCLLKILGDQDVQTDRLLRVAQRHNSQVLGSMTIVRDDVSVSRFEEIAARLEPGEVLALSSRVRCTGASDMHIPMLDFHCRVSVANDRRVRIIASELGLRGYIVHSGQSYHFYGSELIEADALVTLLAKAILFSPIVDRAWIAHQLIERACGLRISAGKTYDQPPLVIDQV